MENNKNAQDYIDECRMNVLSASQLSDSSPNYSPQGVFLPGSRISVKRSLEYTHNWGKSGNSRSHTCFLRNKKTFSSHTDERKSPLAPIIEENRVKKSWIGVKVKSEGITQS